MFDGFMTMTVAICWRFLAGQRRWRDPDITQCKAPRKIDALSC